jgi:DNA-binding NarL/FixJ family response regulator
MINVLLVEDHALITEGLRGFFNDEEGMRCMASCASGESLMKTLLKQKPDVILMDINLPDILGIALCKQVKSQYPGIYVIGLSINNQAGIIRKMIESGASGYVLKDASRQEIMEAIRTVLKGRTFYSRSVSVALRKPGDEKLPALTMRERQVLELIADGHTNAQIAESLFVDVTTIDFHRKNMLAKYKAKNTAALVKIAVSNQLI